MIQQCLCVGVCEWGKSLWVDVVPPATPSTHPPFFMCPWSLWVGYQMLPLSICCLSHKIPPHPHHITIGPGISFHIGSSSLLKDENTDPDSNDTFWSSLPGRHTALLFTHCPSTDHGRNIATLWVSGRLLGTAILPCVKLSNIGSLHPIPQFSYPHFPTVTKQQKLQKEPQMVRNCRKYEILQA